MMPKKDYTKKFLKQERQVIYSAFICEARGLGFSLEAIGQELALVIQAIDNLDGTTEFD